MLRRALLVTALLANGCPSRGADATGVPAAKASAAPKELRAPALKARAQEAASTREEALVVVDDVTETWRLEWRAPPEPACVDRMWSTCLCAGLAFGEQGPLTVVRARPGKEEERLDLSADGTVVQRWIPAPTDEADTIPLEEIKKRPTAKVMRFADYDHDGRATEFVLQIDAGNPCGRTPSIVIGISKRRPTLHVFATPEDPTSWLVLEHRRDWDEVKAKSAVTLIETACGDHGADEEQALVVRVDDAGIHATHRTRACSD